MARPHASRPTTYHFIGDRVEEGTVLVSTRACLTLDDGRKFDGELCIVKLSNTFGGKYYGVTIDGDLIYQGGESTRFRTLKEAATWAQV